jgi:hypothetical protein
MYDFEDGKTRYTKRNWLWREQFARRARYDLIITAVCLFLIGLILGFCLGIYYWEYRL